MNEKHKSYEVINSGAEKFILVHQLNHIDFTPTDDIRRHRICAVWQSVNNAHATSKFNLKTGNCSREEEGGGG